MVPVRASDSTVIDADLKLLLTNTAFSDTLFAYYVSLMQNAAGPVGFNILNLNPSVFDTTFTVSSLNSPKISNLKGIFPNPFRSETSVQYQLFSAEFVKLEIYNSLGRKITTLISEKQLPGMYSSVWDGKDSSGNEVVSGVYLCRLQVSDRTETYGIILLH